MSDNLTTLISLIGKGKTVEGTKGYIKTKYYYDETKDTIYTSFFGSALYKILKKQGQDIDTWLIFGTNRSIWSELLYVVDEKYHDKMVELYDAVYDEENEGISQSLHSQWEQALQEYVPGLSLILVDPLDYQIYIDHMIHEIPDTERKVVLDITHAFRHMPVIIAFSLMALKHIKNISDIMVYYGAFELKANWNDQNEPTPILKIDFINNLVSYAENIAVFNYSGYFPNILEDLNIFKTDETYFWLEMNRQPRTDLETINMNLKEKSKGNNHQAKIAEYINKEIEPLISASLHKRMVERSKFFFYRKQYLKSLILLYEGLIIAIGRKYGFESGQDYDKHEEIRKFIKGNKNTVFKDKDQIKTYFDIEYTRNAAVHGSRSRGTQNFLEQQDHFEALFKKGIEIYKYITEE